MAAVGTTSGTGIGPLPGIAGIVGGLGLLAVEVRALVQKGGEISGQNIDRADAVGYLIWGAGLAVVMWALMQLGATGRSGPARVAPIAGLAGFAAMAVGSLLQAAGLPDSVYNPIVGIAWLLIILGTLLVAILSIAMGSLPGWRRFAPLLCLVAVPVAFLLGPLAMPLFGLSWILLGFAVLTADSQDSGVAGPLRVS